MPEFFQTPGVEEPGETSFHVFTGDGAPFEDDLPPRMRDFVDGTSNTILAVRSRPDTAVIWTKPGGLDVDPAEAAPILGVDKEPVMVLFADGSVRPLPRNIDPQVLQNLVCHSDGHPVPRNLRQATTQSRHVPAVVMHSSGRLPQQKLVRHLLGTVDNVVSVEVAGRNTWIGERRKVVFVDEQTLIAGTQETVEGLIQTEQPGPTGRYLREHPHADVLFAADLSQLQQAPVGNTAALALLGGVIRSIRQVHGHLNLSHDADNQLIEVALVTEKDHEARALLLMVQGMVQAGQGQLMSLIATGQLPVSEEQAQPVIDLLRTVVVAQEQNRVLVRLPHPQRSEELTKALAPALQALKQAVSQRQRQARAMQNQNSMKQILLAFHNYHDVYNSFPNHNGGPNVDEGSEGLSWRVHLLPFLEQEALYDQFKLDEPWDSEHNKPLIEQMPDLFRGTGVEHAGHTSIHVFVGEQTPFNDDTKGTSIRDFTDGTSNTILTVEAGPDTAVPWTKPGGIEFTGEDILQSLGRIDKQFLVGFSDGSVRIMSADVDEILLMNLIRYQDGNVIPRF